MLDNTKTAGSDPAVLEKQIGLPTQQPHYSTPRPTHSPDLQTLKSSFPIESLVKRAGVTLKQSGSNLRGKCPLHNGDNPTAFVVYPDTESWFCYRCQKGGDSIAFVQEWQDLDFQEALQWMTRESGSSTDITRIPVPPRPRTDILDAAASFFSEQLWGPEGQTALTYLLGRGLTEATLRLAGWGFSRSNNDLRSYLSQKGCDLSLAHDVGLIRKDGQDFTANANGVEASPTGYIIIPHFENGHAIYFSARAVAPLDPDNKSRNLPGERQVYWATVKGRKELAIVEGQTDAESLRQLGFSALALCGVGQIPESDLRRALHYSRLFLALDNDTLIPDLPDSKRTGILQRKNETLARLAGQAGPLLMILPELPFKDFNAGLQDGLTAAQVDGLLQQAHTWFEVLLERTAKAEPHEQDFLLSNLSAQFHRLPKNLQTVYRAKVRKMLDLGIPDLNKLLDEKNSPEAQGYAAIKNGCLYFMNDPVGNFSARITHELSMDDGLNPPVMRYRISGELADGVPLQPVEILAEEFSKLTWMARHWGMRPILYLPPGRYYQAARAIQEYSLPEMVRERLYTYSGWVRTEERQAFLSASGEISVDGLNPAVRVDLGENNLRHYALPAPTTGADEKRQAVQASLHFLEVAPRRVSAPLWAAMFAAPLTAILPFNAILWVYGTTQTGKSTLVHLALTHFGAGFVQGRDYHAPID